MQWSSVNGDYNVEMFYLNLTLTGPTPPQNLQLLFIEVRVDNRQRWKCTATWIVSLYYCVLSL